MVRNLSYFRATLLASLALLPVLVWGATNEATQDINWAVMVTGLLFGLALFLYGMQKMEESLRAVAGDRMKMWLRRFTINRFAGVATGTGVTAVIQSSSVTTAMLVSFVSAGLMTFERALPVILGANIGTTITAQLIAFKVTSLTAVLGLGFYVTFIRKNKDDTISGLGKIMLGLSLLFLGMNFMSDAMRPLREYAPFMDLMAEMSNPLLGILVAALFTALVQSSSATMGVIVALATQGLITIEAGIALALGANIGTCVTAGLASIGKSREAKRVALVHVAFNVAGALLIVGFIPQLVELVSAYSDSTSRQVANAHTVFNVMAAVLFLPFTNHLADMAVKILPSMPDIPEEPVIKPKYLVSEKEMEQPMMGAVALVGIQKETLRMAKKVRSMFKAVLPAMLSGEEADLDRVVDMDQGVNILNHAIAANIHAIGRSSIPLSTDKQMDTFRALWAYPEHLETAADEIKSQLVRCGRDRIRKGAEIREGTRRSIEMFHKMVLQQFDLLLKVIEQSDADLTPDEEKKLEKKLRAIVKKRKDIRKLKSSILLVMQQTRLESKVESGSSQLRLTAYSIEMDMIEHIESVYRKIREMAKNRTFYFIEKPEDDEPDDPVSVVSEEAPSKA